MTRKRKQPEPDLESFFARLFACAKNTNATDIPSFLTQMKKEMESDPAEDHKTAGSYTLDNAVAEFDLTYSPKYYDNVWDIEGLREVEPMEPSPCLGTLLKDYSEIYDRSSEAACRIGVDLILCSCIAQMRAGTSEPQPSDEDSICRPSTPNSSDNIRVYCEVSFNHTIISPQVSAEGTVVGGRVDHGIGLLFKQTGDPRRCFHSLLLCVEAKVDGMIVKALGQLVAYLASLRQSRIKRKKSDSSVYGVATDGFIYVFVTISHDGVLTKSRPFHVMHKELPIVLGALRYILKKAMSMSPKQGIAQSEEIGGLDDADEVIDVYDRKNQDDDEEENED